MLPAIITVSGNMYFTFHIAVQPNASSFSQSTLFDEFTEDDRSNLLQCMFPGDQFHDLSNMIIDGSPSPHTGTDCMIMCPRSENTN